MFGIGMPELLLILAVALIIIGPKKLPGLAKSLGKAMGEFKRATNDLKETISVDPEFQDVKKAFDDMNTEVKDSFKRDPSASASTSSPDFGKEKTSDPESAEADTEDSLGDLNKAFKGMNSEESESVPEDVTDEPPADESAEKSADETKSSKPDSNI
jgi:sec-independent protein translocase protein TatB